MTNAAEKKAAETFVSQIAQIDRASDAVTRKLRRRECIDRMSAESWQSAWDRHPELHAAFRQLSMFRGELQKLRDETLYGFKIHEHSRINSHISPTPRLVHSHRDGDWPHTHDGYGPAFYGRGKNKTTKRPTGEQLRMIEISPEENTFELIVTDSAMIHATTPIGDTPIEALGFPAANRIMTSFRMNCVIRDERTGKCHA